MMMSTCVVHRALMQPSRACLPPAAAASMVHDSTLYTTSNYATSDSEWQRSVGQSVGQPDSSVCDLLNYQNSSIAVHTMQTRRPHHGPVCPARAVVRWIDDSVLCRLYMNHSPSMQMQAASGPDLSRSPKAFPHAVQSVSLTVRRPVGCPYCPSACPAQNGDTIAVRLITYNSISQTVFPRIK